MSKENVETLLRIFDAWNRGDIDALVELFHPKLEFISDTARLVEGADTMWRGREGVRRFWDEVQSVWNLHVEISETRDLGDTVVALGHIQTRGKTSGVELESPIAYVAKFDGSLVRKWRSYLDPGQALEAVDLQQPADH